MSEALLNALVHLFALVANQKQDVVSQKGKEIVELYLSRYLNSQKRII